MELFNLYRTFYWRFKIWKHVSLKFPTFILWEKQQATPGADISEVVVGPHGARKLGDSATSVQKTKVEWISNFSNYIPTTHSYTVPLHYVY